MWGVPRPVLIVAVALVGILLVRSFLVQSFFIPSGSMEQTLEPGDRIAVNRLAYDLGAVQRGDVVVFDGSGLFIQAAQPSGSVFQSARRVFAWAFGSPVGSHMYVKRVIGLPGERVTCCDERGRITVDDVALNETYVYPGDAPSELRFDVVVPAGRIWVMGDHRAESADSRAHLGDPGGGTIPLNRIVGRAEAVYWPLGRAGRLQDPELGEHAKERP